MKPLKMFCVGLLCPVLCFLLETPTPSSALLTFEVKEKAGLKSGAMSVFAIKMNVPDFERQKTQVSGLQWSWTSKLKNYLSDFFKSSIPPAAIFAFFVSTVVVEIVIENKGFKEPHRQWIREVLLESEPNKATAEVTGLSQQPSLEQALDSDLCQSRPKAATTAETALSKQTPWGQDQMIPGVASMVNQFTEELDDLMGKVWYLSQQVPRAGEFAVCLK
ncbi:small integral membrane protein 9 [Microtus pennsylvanicus]|uniref:small integral membrane protein 9 n=1 Tax=Microtus pennsylvanicus TaxID=10058 RepID=UPI003F6C4B9B